MNRRAAGAFGEEVAARYLRKKGYEIVARNVHSRFGEIDLIGKQGAFVVFVEVKLRASAAFASPCESVTASKQRKILLTAMQWLEEEACMLQPRFDVIEILCETKADGSKALRSLSHIQNAFDADGL